MSACFFRWQAQIVIMDGIPTEKYNFSFYLSLDPFSLFCVSSQVSLKATCIVAWHFPIALSLWIMSTHLHPSLWDNSTSLCSPTQHTPASTPLHNSLSLPPCPSGTPLSQRRGISLRQIWLDTTTNRPNGPSERWTENNNFSAESLHNVVRHFELQSESVANTSVLIGWTVTGRYCPKGLQCGPFCWLQLQYSRSILDQFQVVPFFSGTIWQENSSEA